MASTTADLGLQNCLANSPSPYLRAHKDNPVAWQEWNSETLALAKTHQRLIFLSVGYSACHWCHVMERESFCSREVAGLLNSNFIPIKVDREARPDLDEIYMSYVTATAGSGGWPLSVFLTPDLTPVFGGSYWPGPRSETPMPTDTSDEKPPTFVDILHKMKDVWATEKEKCIQSAADMTSQLKAFAEEGTHSSSEGSQQSEDSDPPEPLDLDLIDDALEHFKTRYDSINGGFAASPTAPKFPAPVTLQFLLRVGASIGSTHTRFGFPAPLPGIIGKESCTKAASMVLHTLMAISRSGLRDQLGHGFHRYSVTPDWNLPHFEKMLCDNAQLLNCYCDAWALGRDPEILGTIYSLVEYFTNPDSPIVRPEGGWHASEDADSVPSNPTADGAAHEKKEGAFYVWTYKRFVQLLGERNASILARHFGVKPDGNVPASCDIHDEFLSQNVLHIDATPSKLAQEFALPEEEIVKIIKDGRSKLTAHRQSSRPRPDVDTKFITSWNALAIAALANASYTLQSIDKDRAKRCRVAATKALAFIRTNLYDEGTGQLTRIYDPSNPTRTAFLDDYAYLVEAALWTYDVTFDRSYLTWAAQLQTHISSEFQSPSGAYYQTPNGASDTILRLKPGTDNTLPCRTA
ncbi:Spermatogenesis-associated protein 20 [Cyphellophora attinorum]|uniref:Spermatogenesis-associated protein 20 n=1 Tax=Cyphellophora attinorum TaxID=1664694 RepID=A0A0N0NJ60_9EURO|nr:Spermatogenesis-associated protein 20 [Phialophora attinorum]KPI36611.1 Spermatogenesis-associated protein 20 [Phialophora attinorum]